MKVNARDVLEAIKSIEYERLGVKTVVCLVTLDNGHEIVGTSACVDPAEFDSEIGMECAYEDALSKAWQLLGFRLQDAIMPG